MTDDSLELDGIADVLDIPKAALAARVSEFTIRQAIRKGELTAFTPGGRDPRRTGRGLGYRIRKQDLESWYFGEAKR